MERLDDCAKNLLDKITIIEEFPLEDINLFSILNMENKEVSAHSSFLYYIFKPFIHNNVKDDTHLKILFKKIMKIDCVPDYIDISREVSTDFGRLDFLINYEIKGIKNAIVIELKIWAGEQFEQIERYKTYLISNNYSSNNIFFLTPYSKKSTTGKSENITLNNEIKNSLIEIKELRKKEYPDYVVIIDQYIKIIDKLTGDRQMCKTNIITNANDIKAVGILYNERQKVLEYILDEFISAIKFKLKSNTWLSKLENDLLYYIEVDAFEKSGNKGYYTSSNKVKPLIPLKLNKKYLKPEYDCLINKNYDVFFNIEIDYKLYTSISLTQYVDKKFKPVNLSHSLRKKCNINTDKFTEFLIWDYIKYNNREINFNDYENRNNGMLNLLKNDSLNLKESYMNLIVNDIIIKFKEYIFKFFDYPN